MIGEDEAADELEAAATVGYAVNKSVLRLTRQQVAEPLPPLLAETLPLLPDLQAGHSFAMLCRGTACLPPTADPEQLLALLAE